MSPRHRDRAKTIGKWLGIATLAIAVLRDYNSFKQDGRITAGAVATMVQDNVADKDSLRLAFKKIAKLERAVRAGKVGRSVVVLADRPEETGPRGVVGWVGAKVGSGLRWLLGG